MSTMGSIVLAIGLQLSKSYGPSIKRVVFTTVFGTQVLIIESTTV